MVKNISYFILVAISGILLLLLEPKNTVWGLAAYWLFGAVVIAWIGLVVFNVEERDVLFHLNRKGVSLYQHDGFKVTTVPYSSLAGVDISIVAGHQCIAFTPKEAAIPQLRGQFYYIERGGACEITFKVRGFDGDETLATVKSKLQGGDFSGNS